MSPIPQEQQSPFETARTLYVEGITNRRALSPLALVYGLGLLEQVEPNNYLSHLAIKEQWEWIGLLCPDEDNTVIPAQELETLTNPIEGWRRVINLMQKCAPENSEWGRNTYNYLISRAETLRRERYDEVSDSLLETAKIIDSEIN